MTAAPGMLSSMSFADKTDVDVQVERVRTLSADQDQRQAVPETIIDMSIFMPSIVGLGCYAGGYPA